MIILSYENFVCDEYSKVLKTFFLQDIRSLGDDDQSDEAGKLIRAPH
jgi:hypothetical protein